VTLRFDDRWVWDFWLADEGPLTHVFYLQAPRSLGDRDGELQLLGFVDRVDGRFVGELADPQPFDATGVAVAGSSG